MLAQESIMAFVLLNNAIFKDPAVSYCITELYTPSLNTLTERIFPQVAQQRLDLIDQDLNLLVDDVDIMRVNVVGQSILSIEDTGPECDALKQAEELLMTLVLVLDDMLALLALNNKVSIPLGATA